MEETLSEAIENYCDQRRHQLNSIDDTRFAGGDTMINELTNLRITDKLPILNGWVETLTSATHDLIKTIKDVEQTILREDRRSERMAAHVSTQQQQHQSHNETCEPVKRKKSKNKLLTKNLENNNHTISRNSPAARLLLSDDLSTIDDDGGTLAATASAVKNDVNSIGFCANLFKRMFTKERCDERPIRTESGSGNGRINNIEYVYVDKSVCCMSSIINEKLTNTTELRNAETLYADFKANCMDRMQTLQNVTTALQSSLGQQEEMSAQHLEEIEQLRRQIKRLKKYRRSNRVLEANVKSICEENANLLVEARQIEKKLRLLRKRQADTVDGTSQ